jgi:hypothetical protein
MKGIDIHLNKNQNNDYLIKFNNITTPEVIQPELYIQNCFTNNINNQNTQIELVNDGFYKLSSPTIKTINFKSYDINKIKDIYCTSLNDIQILKLFVTIIDNYGVVDDFSILTNSMYQIKRDDISGMVIIKISFNDIKLIGAFFGFKKVDNNFDELDASKTAYNIIPEELDDKKIRDIFISNDFSESVIKESLFEIIDFDNFNGISKLKITNGQLMNRVYKIKNLQPYYIKVKDKIDKKYLFKISSNINIDELKNHYLDVSTEF